MNIKNLINILTFSRILFAPIIFLLIISPKGNLLALILFFLAGISDYFDGYLARKYNAVSKIGEILDPIADKILIVFVFVALSLNFGSFYMGFMCSLIISREIWVGALRDFNSRTGRSDATKVTFLAKIKTSIQLTTISMYLIAIFFNNMLLVIVSDIFLLASTLITIYTGLIYSINSLRNQS
tara:strand:- start:4224 stop:4772 length:549 start_codon:yes stop_codon:yes gene_type:complete